MDNLFTRRFIVALIIVVFIASPVCAFFGVQIYRQLNQNTLTSTPPERTIADIQSLFNSRTGSQYPEVEVKSIKRFEDVWYLADLKYKNQDDSIYRSIIGDFYNSASKMRIILEPGKQLIRYNISNMGLPYELIDELNKD